MTGNTAKSKTAADGLGLALDVVVAILKECVVGVRETLNKHPGIAAGTTIIFIIVTILFTVRGVMKEREVPKYHTTAYYSDDDGASYFEGDNRQIPPIDHNGKLAYRAAVFTCDKGKTKWVAYLHGYLPEARQKLLAIREQAAKAEKEGKPAPDSTDAVMRIARTGLVYKLPDKPGQAPNKWVSEADGAAYARVKQVACPDGQEPMDALLPQ